MNAQPQRGFTLIELMIAVAIIAIISAIAIPAYLGYVQEAKLSTLRLNIDGMRVFIEDYRLDNGTYVAAQWKADGSVKTLESEYGWTPDGDKQTIDYTVTVNPAGTYDVVAVDTAEPDIWVRCENRMGNCCFSDTPGAAKTACPAGS